MRFMMIVKANKDSEDGKLPSASMIAATGRYSEELAKAGVLLGGEGLHPTSKGARVKFAGGKATVVDGPFAEVKELIGGYWLLQVKSKEEAIEWARRYPPADDGTEGELELRQLYELEDFPSDLISDEDKAKEKALFEGAARNAKR
ncbi:MAG: YciI family protein [Polyangiaceae bacterium]